MEKESWKDVLGYERLYKISNLGNVKTFHYNRDRLLSQCNNKDGYKMVFLSKNKKKKTITVHLLMAITFLNHTPGRKVVVDHKDNDKINNRLNNIQIITQRQNTSKDKHNYKSSSKHIGVSWNIQKRRWIATIHYDKKSRFLGLYKNELDAAKAYQDKLKEINNK